MKRTIYLAGPMRGREFFNFPAFERITAMLDMEGWVVVSPHEMDLERGFNPFEWNEECQRQEIKPDWNNWPPQFADRGIKRDVIRKNMDVLLDCDAIWMMEDWKESVGATSEYWLARFAGLEILGEDLDAGDDPQGPTETVNHVSDDCEDVCDEAKRLTSGDRNASYGPPDEDLGRTAGFWTHYLGTKVTAADVCEMMTLLKMSRQKHRPKRDNQVDKIGYQRLLQLMLEGKQP